eukprot:gene24619-33087_t
MDTTEPIPLNNDENCAAKDEISFTESQKLLNATSTKRRKKKALTTINQNVALNAQSKGAQVYDTGKSACANSKSELRTSTEIPLNSDSESREELDFYSRSTSKNNENISMNNTINRQENFRTVSKSTSGDNFKEKESRRLKVILSEKDRQLASLQHMLQLSQAAVQDLQVAAEKHKRNELEARKTLSAKETYCRRQSAISNMQMKTIHTTLQKFYTREERLQIAAEKRLLRSQLDRKDLEDEMERVESEFEQRLTELSESHKAELEALESKSAEELNTMQTQCNAALAEQVLKQTESYNETLHHFEHALALLEGQAVKAANTNSSLQEEVSTLKEHNAHLLDSTVKYQAAIESLQQELESSLNINSTLSEELSVAKQNYDQLEQRFVESTEKANHAQAAEIEQLKSVNSKYAVQLKRNAAELSRRISQYASMQARLDDTAHKLSYLEQQGLDKEQEFGAEVETKHNIFRSLKEENRSLEESLSLASDEIKRLRDEEYLHTCVISDMTREIQLLVHQRREIQGSNGELQQMVQLLQQDLDSKLAIIHGEEKKVQGLSAELEDANRRLKLSSVEIAEKEANVASLGSQIEAAEKKIIESLKDNDTLKAGLSKSMGQLSHMYMELQEQKKVITALNEERNRLKALQQESLQHTDSLFDALTAEEHVSAGLQREVEKQAETLRNMAAELQSLEVELKDFNVAKDEIVRLQSALDEKTQSDSSSRQQLASAIQQHRDEIEKLTETNDREIQTLIEERNSWKSMYEDATAAAALQAKQLTTLNMAAADEISAMVSKNQALFSQLQQAKDELADNNSAYADQVGALEQENEELLDQLHVLRQENGQLSSQIASMTTDSHSMQQRLQNMFDELATMQQRYALDSNQLISVLSSKDAELAALKSALADQDSANDGLQSELQALTEAMEQSHEEKEVLLRSLHSLQAANQSLSSQLEVVKAEVDCHLLQIKALEEEKIRALDECSREAALSRENDKQRMQMLESQLSAAKSENKNLSSENAKLSGHSNSKQKIHYIENLKVQLQNLMDENAKLKEDSNLK